MHFERILPVASGDPLRYTDAGSDPLFDPEEPDHPHPPPRRRRRSRAAAATAVVVTLACGGAERPAIHATDAILVQLLPGASPPARFGGADTGPPIVALGSLSPHDEAPLLRIPLQPGDDPVAAAEQASHGKGVEFAEPVYTYQPSRAPNDPRYRDLWGLARIGVPGAWDRTTGERAVTVAVVDDGVALDHPDLKSNLWVNEQEQDGNGLDDDGDGYVDDVNGYDFVDDRPSPAPAPSGDARWHGTHAAGIIGAAGDNRVGVVGVNWKVSLMALRALGPSGGRSDDLARAIDFAADHGARVINAAWGGGGASQVLARAIARAGSKGALVVAAAGNGAAESPEAPANLDLDNLLSVGATTPEDLLAPFSNRGALLAAPGVGILSTTAPGQYERYDGTSMASAHVAGVAALLWAAHPDASLGQVRDAIVSSAVPIPGVVHGRVDAAGALAALDGARGVPGALQLSRAALTFSAKPGRLPRAQTVSVRAEGGGQHGFTAETDAAFILLKQAKGTTPARVAVRVDPSKLAAGKHQGSVTFKDASGASLGLSVTLQIGDAQALAVRGEGCRLGEDGKLHARAGTGCMLSAAEGEAATVQWRLPGGEEVRGARLYAQFVRRGEFQVLYSPDEGAVDPLAVVIE
jgi:subtilisin family serine protease